MIFCELEKLLIEHSAALRAIPMTIVHVTDTRHINNHPDGKIIYLDKYKREMLVYEQKPVNGGKFLLELNQGTMNLVRFSGKKYFDSIEQVIEYLKTQ